MYLEWQIRGINNVAIALTRRGATHTYMVSVADKTQHIKHHVFEIKSNTFRRMGCSYAEIAPTMS